MKKVLLVLALAIAGHFAIAQNVQVQNAFNDQKAAQQYIDQADVYKSQKKDEKAAKQMQNAKLMIQKAKTAIDAASVHEATMNQPKTWHYYAVIYYKIGAYPEFVDIDMNAYEKVLDAFVKIKNIDNDYFMRNVGEFRQYASSIGAGYMTSVQTATMKATMRMRHSYCAVIARPYHFLPEFGTDVVTGRLSSSVSHNLFSSFFH